MAKDNKSRSNLREMKVPDALRQLGGANWRHPCPVGSRNGV